MPKSKNLKEIKDELLEAFVELEASYINGPNTSDPAMRIAYLQIEICEQLLNNLKALEYHYRDDVPEMRTLKRQTPELKNARKLIKKYGENKEAGNEFSSLQLQRKFDTTGYLEHRDFFAAAKDEREKLKKNFRK
jgi:hypothetical protein